MLNVTDKAARYLRESLTRKKEGDPAAIRIVHTEDGYQLTLDDPKDGDQAFEQDGQNYLLVAAELTEMLSDAKLDVHDSAQGARLTLTAARSPEPEPESEAASESGPEAKPQSESEPPSPSP